MICQPNSLRLPEHHAFYDRGKETTGVRRPVRGSSTCTVLDMQSLRFTTDHQSAARIDPALLPLLWEPP
jgi:hypothetical protein